MNTALRITHISALITAGLFLVLLTAQPAFAETRAAATVASTGASCTTLWGNKVVAHGKTISSQPYFSNGVGTGTVVVPLMRCNNGVWLRCDYRGNNCTPIAGTQRATTTSTDDTPTSADRSNPLPHLLKDPRATTSTENNSRNWAEMASSTRAHFLDQANRLLKNRLDNEKKREDQLSKIAHRVSDSNFKAIKSIVERLGDAHDKLSDLLSKIEESLAKAATAGKDVTAAQTAVTQAETDLTAAQTAIDGVQTVIDTATASSTQITNHIGEIRTAVNAAIEKIKTAHTSVTAALTAARGAAGTSNVRVGNGK